MLSPALGSSTNTVASLSRAFAREIENLPTRYLREFYKIKVEDDIKALPSPESPNFNTRYKRVSKELRKLEAANSGNSAAYEHVLFLAYGRKGKLRWELMEPLLSDPSAPLPPPIIPTVESSRPPAYSPEIVALLGSASYRYGSSTRSAKQLQNPPNLPMRADPTSSDAKTLGPLSKRREVNLKWRFFEQETAKVRPPIEVSRVHATQTSTSLDKPVGTTTVEGNMARQTPPAVGFQGTSVLRDLEFIASPNPNVPKRTENLSLPNRTNDTSPTSTVNRFIRRQHRKLLGKIPIITYFKHPNSPVGRYQVSLSPLVHSGPATRLASAVPTADDADLAWLRLPPPPQEPTVKLESPPSQDFKAKANEMENTKPEADQVRSKLMYDARTQLQKPNWVDSDNPPDKLLYRHERTSELKVEPKPEVAGRPKAKMGSKVDKNPQAPVKPFRTVRPRPQRSNRIDEPPNQLNHRPKDESLPNSAYPEDPKKPRSFDQTADEKPRRGESSCSNSPTLKDTQRFNGYLVEEGLGEPCPKPE